MRDYLQIGFSWVFCFILIMIAYIILPNRFPNWKKTLIAAIPILILDLIVCSIIFK